tara:strand:+ start:17813 stop:19330 length:1518 start_codon:yes stop_codon:yes gene_type:complete
MSEKTKPEFSKVRSIIFPVYAFELKKVLPMGMIFFFILFNYTCLRNIKDTLVVTAAGAEVIPFLKFFCVTPAAFIFMALYVQGSNIFNRQNLFYVTIIPFIIFFGLFGFFIYPNKELLHPSAEYIAHLKTVWPHGLHRLLDIFQTWSYSTFYILAEIWGSAILSLLFWQFANQITKVPEAKRFYAFFGFMAQLALLLAGELGEHFSRVSSNLPAGADPWQHSLYWLMGTVVVFGFGTVALYKWMHMAVLTDKRFYDESESVGSSKKKKPKLGFLESFQVIFTSPYLMMIAFLVIAYGTTINFVEGVWKSQLKLEYPSYNEYNTFMSKFTFYTGIATMIMLVVGGNILRKFRWTTAAIITPVTMLIAGSCFFGFILYRDELTPWISQMGTNPIAMAVLFGAAVVIMTKSTKYALFDLTKEMAYIPLDDEMKVKGKAVVDVVGGRLGKSTGAGIQTGLFILVSTITATSASFFQIAPYVAGLFLVFSFLWIVCVKCLGKRVEAISNK